jgi:DeoR/GlpR family transcriptional regulator of sugar metabolism
MPPIRNKTKSNSQEQEERIQLALSNLKNKKIRSIQQAAEIYNVSRSTLQNRLNGKAYQAELRANNHKLTKFKEKSLIK